MSLIPDTENAGKSDSRYKVFGICSVLKMEK